MSIVKRIQEMCDSKDTTLIGLERELKLGRGTIRRWDETSPSAEKLQKVADYFGVTTDYLLSRDINAKGKRDILRELDAMRKNLMESEGLLFDGEPASEEAIASILDVLEVGMQIAKRRNKEKYTPTKYKK